MERKRFLKSMALIALTPSLFFAACKNEKKVVSTQKFTCPMHPQVIKDAPGTCPICAMDLVLVHSSGEKNEITLSDSQVQLANIVTMQIASGDFTTSKLLNGRLVTNPELTEMISSRYAGRVERLYIKETGRSIVKGQPLFQIYSEELQILQQDYLLQVRQSAAFPGERIYVTLREAAKNKLLLFGVSKGQIASLLKRNNPSPLLTVNATASGVVREISVSEGQYVSEGASIIRLENLNELWIEADVYPAEARTIKIGTPLTVSIDGFPELRQTVKVDFIAPQIDASTQVLKIRAAVQSEEKLQPGMQVTASLPTSEVTRAVALPLDAVIREEQGAHVWIKTRKNTFAPAMVTTSEEDASKIIITSGLESAKEVVISGAYLLSSEFILKKGKNPNTLHNH